MSSLGSTLETVGFGLAVILVIQILLWLISLKTKDVSIVDTFWGFNFVVLSWLYWFISNQANILVPVLTSIWGLRLTLHIFFRNKGKGEDKRYTGMRAGKENFVLWSLFFVFLFQGLLGWLIAMPLYFVQLVSESFSSLQMVFLALGILLWALGFVFESVGDWQLKKFKSNSANKGRVLKSGLWAYTRHPNYFGDACVWCGFFLLTLGATGSLASLFLIYSPALMTFFLLRVSGVSLLEKDLTSRKPEYLHYIRTTSSFIPRCPKP